VYNIQKAVSRLEFAPKLKEIEVTDIQKGLGVFTPKPNKRVSFAALRESLKKAGYALDSADITVAGTLAKSDKGWSIVVEGTQQEFVLIGPNVEQAIGDAGSNVEISGDWKTASTGSTAYETISLSRKTNATGEAVEVYFSRSGAAARRNKLTPRCAVAPLREELSLAFVNARFVVPLGIEDESTVEAPIRVTSPGLTVYKGGAVTPRLYLIKQHLGDLEVNRQAFDVSVSYTPSPRLQLEIEVPFSRTSYDDNVTSGSRFGLGNVTAWAKYRFFRKVKTYGDRQAAFRIGLETPTGKKSAPTQTQINAPAFVRQQLTPINGGLAPHFDLAFSQAGGRIIFGGNAEVIFRGERDGFRLGHEQRVSTDLEYVLPKDARKPGGEVFLILETTFVHRSTGRLNGQVVDGSRSTEYYLAPGLQYAALPRFVVEGSYQFPVLRNTGPLVLRTDRNLLLGVRYLF
jgi:Putative MetA-pathway of phenol degradation